jgi:hypothetical protein
LRIPILGANLMDIGAYLNQHADSRVQRFVTRRSIWSGEEMTVDYATYGAADLL